MGMSGKTFLSAFQMGAKMYPDIVQSREDQIDRELKRSVIDLQKKKMETDRDIAASLRDREVIGMTSLNNLQTGYAALDMNDPKFPSQWRKLVKNNITGIGMSKRSLEGFNTIKETVVGNEIFKAKEEAEADALVAIDWWNKHNPLKKVGPDTPPDFLDVVNDSYKDYLQEEKNKATRADVVATAEAQVGVADEAKFKTFVEETGSPYKPGDYAKPEAKNAMRIHNQLGEVKELLMEVGEEGLPIASKLAIRSDGSGYKNLLEVKTELVTLNNKLKEQRGSKGKSLSEAQGNAFAYSERMRANNRVIDQMEILGLVPENDILNTLLVRWGRDNDVDFWNVVVDPKYQQFKSAADNFIRATLRKESGAAISQDEYKGAFRDYIPRMGDSPGLVKQKRRLRIGVANVMRRQSGMAWDSGDEFPLAPFQFNDLDQAKKFAALGYVEDGDEVLIKSGDSWATHKLNSKKKTIATP
tara:strand:- start:910 stop:2322 length:1413 start_codon:yes stop_codon:yes gene_type:complete